MIANNNNNNIRFFFFIARSLILLSALFACQLTYASCSKINNASIQKIIEKARITYHIPGIEVSVSCHNEKSPRDFASGTTSIETNTPVTPNHLFQIGSETKSYIAAILLQLEAEGLISLNDPVDHWVSVNLPDSDKISIKQLLNHTSGLFSYTEADEFLQIEENTHFQKEWVAGELINFIAGMPPYFEPGLGWHYSDTNYVLAGMIISSVTGHSVEEELNNRIFKPLHLNHTYYLSTTYPDHILQQMAHGYKVEEDELIQDVTNINMSLADAAGAIVSSSHDTAIWLRKLLTSSSVLTKNQRNKLMSIVDYNSGLPVPKASDIPGYGLGITRGFDINNVEIWGHSGGMPGYLSNMAWLKEKDIVITTLININNPQGSYDLLNKLVAYVESNPSRDR